MHGSGDSYVVRWKEWYSGLLNGVHVAMNKPHNEEEEDEPLPEDKEEHIVQIKREEESE